MRLEQKSFAEKYIEKIVLLVAVLIGGWILMTFVMNDPYNVEMNGQVQSPEKIEEDIRRKAQALQRKVGSDQVAPELDHFTVPNYVQRFWTRHNEELVARNIIPVPLVRTGVPYGPGTATGILKEVQPVDPPAPTKLAVRDSYHVVETDERLRTELFEAVGAQNQEATTEKIQKTVDELIENIHQLVGEQAPRDVRQTLIRATIDLEKYKDALLAGDEELRVPKSWWEPYSDFITDVVIERQTLNPETGEWGDLIEIKPLPGSTVADIRALTDRVTAMPAKDEDQAVVKKEWTRWLIERMRFYVDDIAQPRSMLYQPHTPLYTSAEAPPELELSDADQRRLFDLRKEIADTESKLRRLIGSTNQTPGNLPPRGVYGEGFDSESGLPDGRRPSPRPTPRPTPRPSTGDGKRPDAAAARAARQQERIKLYQDKLAKLLAEQAKILGQDDEADPNNPANPRNRSDPSNPNPEFNREYRDRFDPEAPRVRGSGQRPGTRRGDTLEEGKLPTIEILGHDLTIEHGKTYRYRVSYKVINPLYQKDVQPEEVKNEYYSKLLIASKPSEWSQPVSIEKELELFVNDASAQSNTAKFELYRILNGRRVKHVFTVSPGDPVGGVAQVQISEPTLNGGIPTQRTVDVDVRMPIVLVDVKEPPRAKGAIGRSGPVSVILADTASGDIQVRNVEDDQQDLRRIQLDNEVARSGRTTVGLNR